MGAFSTRFHLQSKYNIVVRFIFTQIFRITLFNMKTAYGILCFIAASMVVTINGETILDIIADPQFSTLKLAIETADLGSDIADADAVTVFAPTNDAFAKALEAKNITAEELLAMDNLGDILKYHVVGAKKMSTDLTDGEKLETLLGPEPMPMLMVKTTDDPAGVIIMCEDGSHEANVIDANKEIDNGVVHVLDAVLFPEMAALANNATDAGGDDALAGGDNATAAGGDDSSDAGATEEGRE